MRAGKKEGGSGKKKYIPFVAVFICALAIIACGVTYRFVVGRQAKEAWAARVEREKERAVAYRDFIGCSFQHNIACLIVHQTRLHCYKILCTFLCQFYERRAPAYHLKHIHPCIHRRIQHFLGLGRAAL